MRRNDERGKRGIGGSSAGALMRACRPVIALILVTAPVALLTAPAPSVPQGGAPVVSPDRIDDVRSLKPDVDPFPDVDNFAWRAFIALNWPSLTDDADRGVPDRTRTLGDPGPRVWETFKARYGPRTTP